MLAPKAREQAVAACDEQFDAEAPLVSEVPAGGMSEGSSTVPRAWRPLWLSVVAFGMVGLVVAGVSLGGRSVTTPQGSTDGAVQLSSFGTLMSSLGSLADTVRSTAKLSTQVGTGYGKMTGTLASLKGSGAALTNITGNLMNDLKSPAAFRKHLMAKLHSMNKTERAAKILAWKKKHNISTDLIPKANLHDDNTCMDDEEMYGQLCYKKCSSLTGGKYPHRVSGWSCCSSKPPCMPHSSISFCGGYSVAGESSNTLCPHAQGACLQNEELFDGICYKRCDLLSFSMLKYRLGPATCCNTAGRLAFLNLDSCETDGVYHVGGGNPDSPIAIVKTLKAPHPPVLNLTEA